MKDKIQNQTLTKLNANRVTITYVREKQVHLLQNYLDKQIQKYLIEQIILSNIFLNLKTKILLNT